VLRSDHNHNRHLLLIVGVVDVCGAKADQGTARATILPVVVGIGDMEVPTILGAVAVAVADKGALPVIMEISASGFG
jgi:hypothetical protein